MVQTVGSTIRDTDCAIRVEENIDTIYNNPSWASRIQSIVSKHSIATDVIGIIGHKKDGATEDYINMFPQWDHVDVELIEPLHATNIRDLYFRKDANLNFVKSVVPRATFDLLEQWTITPDYAQLIREREFTESYKKQFAGLQYEPIFVTVDAVVVCSGHVLMIKRKSEPGKGLWAMPGGFLNAATDKSIQAGMIRELREETGIKIPIPVLIGSITKTQVFDAIDRSSRGRTITHAFRIDLPNGELPKVKGLDDAEKAQWVPIAELDSAKCFEDHYEIISTMIGT
jgi:bifunctional NMN adenylyltransferase/nudix hydrolase